MDNFNPGGKQDPEDSRDYPYEGFIGYGIETPLPESYDTEIAFGKISQKDQKQTLSCGGQATAYYAEMLELIENKFLEMSPRSIYAFTHLPVGGSITRENIMRMVDIGIVPEDKFSSQPMTEAHLQSQSNWSSDLTKLAGKYKAKLAVNLTDRTNFDLFKSAIFDGHGVVSGLNLSGEGWYANPIRPPKDGEKIVGHIMYFKGWGKDRFGEYILLKDSYPSGDKKIYQDYFNAGMVHSAWTLIDEPNIGDEMVNKENMNAVLYTLGGKTDNWTDAIALANALNSGDQLMVDKILAPYKVSKSALIQKIINWLKLL